MRRVTSGVCGDGCGRVLVGGGVVDRTMADGLDPKAVSEARTTELLGVKAWREQGREDVVWC